MEKAATILLFGFAVVVGYLVVDALRTKDPERRARDEKDIKILSEGAEVLENI